MFTKLSLLRIYNIQLAYRGCRGSISITKQQEGQPPLPAAAYWVLLRTSQTAPVGHLSSSTRLRDHESSFRDEENQAFQFYKSKHLPQGAALFRRDR